MRSVHLERDFAQPADYYPTESTQRALGALHDALRQPADRALSLIGPYGSGKSAFCVHVAHGLREPERATAGLIHGLLPVLRVGARQPLGPSLVAALQEGWNYQEAYSATRTLFEKQGETGEGLAPREVADLFAQAAAALPGGLLLVIDEFGKFLEYAALHPMESDPFLMQELAEAAARSRPDRPLIVLTVLHQNMEAYARSLSRSQQAEWQKVSQRFRQVQFFPSDRERIELVGKALQHDANVLRNSAVRQSIDRFCDAYAALSLIPPASDADWRQWAYQAYPLHPLTLLALPVLFRRVGQSYRSLFTFLSSEEPHALGDFLLHRKFSTADPPFYTPDLLFDYGATALAQGSALSREWAEALEAVEAGEGTLSPSATVILKAIALLGLLRDAPRLPASEELLQATYPQLPVSQAIQDLMKQRRILYRRRLHTYRVWEGGDVDVEGVLQEARVQIARSSAVLKVAEALSKTGSEIARRHSYRTGTLRLVRVLPCTVPELRTALAGADTSLQVLYCLATNAVELSEAEAVLDSVRSPNLLVALSQETERLQDAALDVIAADRVFAEVRELEHDRAARRELGARYTEAQAAFQSEWRRLFATRSDGGDGATRFWYQGAVEGISALAPFLSNMADATYPSAPRLRNELINRNTLSATVAAARRTLIERMLSPESAALPHLGMTGFPPERSIYDCLFKITGLHRQAAEGYRFVAPSTDNDPAGIVPAWQVLERRVLDGAQSKPIAVPELYSVLSQPPYGMTDGVLPVLLCAFLRVYDSQTTFYREGTLVPEPGIADWELLLRRPEIFAINGCRVTGLQQEIVTRLANGLGTEPTVIATIRGLLRITRSLPDYALKTRRISPAAQQMRAAINSARSPEQLLFVDLPQALGCTDLAASGGFFEALNAVLRELGQFLPQRVVEARDGLLTACGLPTGDEGFEQLRQEARNLEPVLPLAPATLAPLLKRASLPGDAATVTETVLAQLADRPPRTWDDATFDRVRSQSLVLGVQFREMVAIAGTLTEPTLFPDEAEQRDRLTAVIRHHVPADVPPRLVRASLLALLREFPAEG
jgi:hypothetical protein